MSPIKLSSFILFFSFYTCQAQENEQLLSKQSEETNKTTEGVTPKIFTLDDYLKTDTTLDNLVQSYLNIMSPSEKIAQLIMPAMGKHGQSKAIIDELVKDGLIGGILMLNGTKEEFKNWIYEYNILNAEKQRLPFLYSADAEPSLINRKINNTKTVAKANTLQNIQEVEEVATTISSELNKIGINYNFAPVVDMSPNKTVGWRSFGHQPENVVPWSNAFISKTQEHQIIATAKHFPGHGYVVGDTHEKLVYIDGEMKEIKNYPELIENGVLSIMIAHIAVKNNPNFSTNNLPATTSRKIVTDLLRDGLNFEGLIITDALNMGGVRNVQNANTLAISAGCDILLMPLDARKAHAELLEAYTTSEEIKNEIEASVKRVVRMKICLFSELNQL